MTTNHKELCEILRDESGIWRSSSTYEAAANLIEQQAARIQQQAERIAELEKERDAILAEVKSALVHERSLYLSKWKREAITACIERVAALQAEKETRS